jgi:nucleoside phosphorylase
MTKHIILFLAANPVGTDPLSLDRQARAIQVELERSGHRDRFELVTRWAAEPMDLLRELRKLKPTVVHFSGHGSTGDPGLYFQGLDGRPQLVSTGAVQQTFGAAGSSVKLVVLSACFSEPQADALLAQVDCVVGMAGAITDDAARSFAIGFYGGLGERESVGDAFRQGCAAISLEVQHGGDQPQLKVRRGVDADRLVLAAAASARPAHSTPPPGADGAPLPPRAAAGPGRPGIDVGILTIRDDEFRAVLGAFPDKAGMHKAGRREYALRHADAGGGERYTLAILRQIEQGNGEAQSAARDLIDDLAPRLVVVVGIAGGLPSDDVTLGDVVLSTRIHDFTVAAHKPGETAYAATGGPIDSALGAAIANLAAREDEMGDWTAELPSRPPVTWQDGQLYGPAEWQRELRDKLEQHHGAGTAPRAPRYIAGPIASSDRLVKDPALLFPWITTARNLLAVEMESGGVYRAARERCPMLAIRGISDIVGLRRADAWTKLACASAAAFTRAFLRTRPVEVGSAAPGARHRSPDPATTAGDRPAGREHAVSPGQTAGTRPTRVALLERLSTLLPAQFEDVVFRANIPPGYLHGGNAPQSVRAIEAIRYLEQRGQLELLAEILQDNLDPR